MLSNIFGVFVNKLNINIFNYKYIKNYILIHLKFKFYYFYIKKLFLII